MSDMDPASGINPAASADHFVLAAMDPNEYIVVHRAGMSVEFVSHVFDVTNNRPIGSRGWFAYWRDGAEISTINACKALSIPTTA